MITNTFTNNITNTIELKKSNLHEKALEVVNRYKKSESDLIDILQQIDEHKIYLKYDCRHLHEYTMRILKLSESVAFNFITVARKAKEVPQLKEVISSGALSVSKARKITSVLNSQNQSQWLKLAVELPQKKLEQEVAKACPKESVPERIKFVSEERLNLQLGISLTINKKLKRAQDLLSQKSQKHISLEVTLEKLLDHYLETHDSIKKSEKIQNRKNLSVARQIELRDRGQCTYKIQSGQRCLETKWLHIHHIKPKNQGGPDTLENLTTLCSGHHRLIHRNEQIN